MTPPHLHSIYQVKQHMEADEKKKAKGSYIKPTGSVSGTDLFQKSTKIIHPSSASSSRTEPPTVASSA